ncbi:hypothetical protein HYG81_20870 (plasmid) [Natrinema zhouii]|uniref:HalOD1 output domain-containing protein n=1 Tax=Natrinema zhouii TaxID=1710539 RepID=UPI001CFF70DF|nr:HalOD1 output domain-containing protein [Natrinema zhouii]UHQ98421.1 hypothetical protein HYG81_20870 [Natrinema zhouii]
MKVVQRVAAVTDQEVTKLLPLYDAIDPEALDSLTESVVTSPASLEIRFTYAGQQVIIDGRGTVSVEN